MTNPMMTVPGAAPAVQRTIPLRNAWLVRQQMRVYSSLQNDWIPWTGGTDLTARFSQFATGYDFSGYPSTVLGPFTLAEVSDPGWYVYNIPADQVTNALKILVGQTVYQIIEGGAAYNGVYGYTGAYSISTAEPLLVIEPRVPL